MSGDVHITGLGLATPAGLGVDDSWKGVLSGRSAASDDPNLEGVDVHISCRVPGFDAAELLGRKAARRLDRFVQLAMYAAREAIADAQLDPHTWDAPRVGVVLGCGMGGSDTWEKQHTILMERGPQRVSAMLIPMLVPNMVAGQIAMDYGAKGPNFVTASACSSGATAIGVARDLLRSGAADIMITGGTEAGLTPLSIAGFAQMGALSTRNDEPELASRPFDVDRDGFVAAEAAGVLVLERAEDAAARGVRTRAVLSGYGASADAHHITAPDPEGGGAELAMRAALEDAGLSAGDIDHVNAHGTSTPLNDASEAATIKRVLGDHVAVTSTKGVTGHSLGAAGAIEAGFSALTIEHGVIPPTANLEQLDPEVEIDVVHGEARQQPVRAVLSSSFAFGGQNAVLVLTAP